MEATTAQHPTKAKAMAVEVDNDNTQLKIKTQKSEPQLLAGSPSGPTDL